ncbi:unnamed protein product [Rhizoctonia solani]|uniref:Peptidase C14 caspase domain-containing protein n=1 Tax=Rhizoctonia solani TaxID=456999 RepID=A0A8H3CZ43_9AGAM|nr:unnamed protein product [Rhizoctonia solani]
MGLKTALSASPNRLPNVGAGHQPASSPQDLPKLVIPSRKYYDALNFFYRGSPKTGVSPDLYYTPTSTIPDCTNQGGLGKSLNGVHNNTSIPAPVYTAPVTPAIQVDASTRGLSKTVASLPTVEYAPALPAITQHTPSKKKKALLIGLSYKQCSDSSRHLRYATQDARRLADALPKLGYSSEMVQVVTDEPGQRFPSAEYLLERIDQLVQGASAGDELVFGYSAHCDPPKMNDSKSEHCLVAADLKPISRSTLHERLIAKVPAGAKLTLVLDCCNAGGLVPLKHCVEQMKPEHRAPSGAPAQVGRRQGCVAGAQPSALPTTPSSLPPRPAPPMFGMPVGVNGPFFPVNLAANMGRRHAQAPIVAGLPIGKLNEPAKELTPPVGDIVVWAATGARLKAFEASGGVENGVFTNAICNVLDTCGADKTITKRDVWLSISMAVTKENELRRERDMKKDPKVVIPSQRLQCAQLLVSQQELSGSSVLDQPAF